MHVRRGRRPPARSRRSARRPARRCPRPSAGGWCAARPATIFGARPWLGSSNSTRPGAPSSARAIATICISPPDRFSHSRCIRYSSGAEDLAALLLASRRGTRVRFLRDATGCAPPSASGRGAGRRAPSRCRARAISCVGARVTSRRRSGSSPRRGARQAEDRAQHRGLAGAVGAEQRHAPRRRRPQRDAEQRLRLAVERVDARRPSSIMLSAPRFERSTQGFARSSSGVPSRDDLAPVDDRDVVGERRTGTPCRAR